MSLFLNEPAVGGLTAFGRVYPGRLRPLRCQIKGTLNYCDFYYFYAKIFPGKTSVRNTAAFGNVRKSYFSFLTRHNFFYLKETRLRLYSNFQHRRLRSCGNQFGIDLYLHGSTNMKVVFFVPDYNKYNSVFWVWFFSLHFRQNDFLKINLQNFIVVPNKFYLNEDSFTI